MHTGCKDIFGLRFIFRIVTAQGMAPKLGLGLPSRLCMLDDNPSSHFRVPLAEGPLRRRTTPGSMHVSDRGTIGAGGACASTSQSSSSALVPQLQARPKGSAKPHAPESSVRAGAPSVLAYATGSRTKALDIATDPLRRSAAKRKLEDKIFAASSRGTRTARLETWDMIAAASGFTPGDMSVELIYSQMGILREADYRSSEMYLADAKSRFIEQGGAISGQLAQACRWAERAAARGRGPAKQAMPLPLEEFHKLPGASTPWCAGGPVCPRRALTVGAWWMLREMELAHIKRGHVRIVDSHTVELFLPVAKADVTALGAHRRHVCCCSAAGLDTCPACAVMEQIKWLDAELANSSPEERDQSPLFPSASGDIVSKPAVIETIRSAAEMLGERRLGSSGVQRFGGHSLRSTGTVFLAKAGVDVWRIQALGRWGSDAVRGYLRGAHVEGLSSISLEAQLGRSLDTARVELQTLQAEAQRMRERMSSALTESENLSDQLSLKALSNPQQEQQLVEVLPPVSISDILDGQALSSVPASNRNDDSVELILNTKGGGRLHAIASGDLHTHPSLWRSVCGWRFGLETAAFTAQRTSDWLAAKLCSKCFAVPRQHAGLPAAASGSSSDSSES
jgi:integrase